MKKIIFIILLLLFSTTASAKEKIQHITEPTGNEKIIIGYEYKYKTKKVKKVKKKYLGKFVITHYCNCSICCGRWASGKTASGTKPKAGKTIAADTSVIPLGTKVKIGKNNYITEDTGGAIKGKRIDIYCNSHAEALKKGIKTKKVWEIYTVIKKKRVRVKCPILAE